MHIASQLELHGENIMNRVLFICSQNTGRSQMAEAILSKLGGVEFQVTSAGLDPGPHVNPLVLEVMKEEGIDLSHKKPQNAFDLFKKSRLFTHVITVCDTATDEKCPVYPGINNRLNWPLPDPETVTGTHAEQLEQVRGIRDVIRKKLIDYFQLKA